MFTPNTAYLDIHRHYELKPSRLALGFRLFCLVVIVCCSVQLLRWSAFVLLLLGLMISGYRFLTRPQIRVLSQLDADQWSIQYSHHGIVQTVQVKQFLDHQLYIVVYFRNRKITPMLIWSDQLCKKSWKSLVVRCRLSKM